MEGVGAVVGLGPALKNSKATLSEIEVVIAMISDKAAVIPLHLHPGFQERQRVKELKTALMTETLAYVQMALDNAAGTSTQAVKILQRACDLLDEARDQLVCELL